MPRLARHAFTALSALSLVLCVATGMLWARSYRHADSADLSFGTGRLRVVTDSNQMDWSVRPGLISIGWSREESSEFRLEHGSILVSDIPTMCGDLRRPATHVTLPGGFLYARTSSPATLFTPGSTSHTVAAPVWSLTLAAAMLPAALLLTQRRRRACVGQGSCPNCGYDLRVQLALSEQRESNGRASPGRCPECGALRLRFLRV